MPFSPTDIAGCKIWLKADALSLNDGDANGSWTDSSGLGNTPTQATAAAKPTHRTNILNGLPVERFDGGDRLTASFTLAQPVTVFVAGKRTGTGAQQFTDGAPGGGRMAVYYNNATGLLTIYAGGPGPIGGPALDTAWHILTVIFNGASSSMRIDGGTATTASPGTASPGGITVGSFNGSITNALVGDIAELIYYDSVLSDANLDLVGYYLHDRYGLAWKQPPMRPVTTRHAVIRASVY